MPAGLDVHDASVVEPASVSRLGALRADAVQRGLPRRAQNAVGTRASCDGLSSWA